MSKETILPSPGGTPTATVSYSDTGSGFGYDHVGNRQSRQVTGTLTGGSYSGHAFNPRGMLNVGNGFPYDANGNTMTYQAASFIYDAENWLVKQTGSGSDANVVYDADGNRVGKTVGTTTTTYLVDGRAVSLTLVPDAATHLERTDVSSGSSP